MDDLKVNVHQKGYSKEFKSYYVTYHILELDDKALEKLKDRLKDPFVEKCGELFLTVYFDEKYYPFKSDESQKNPSDFRAREELEMTAYLLDLLED